jgi:hypothetical protein
VTDAETLIALVAAAIVQADLDLDEARLRS